MSKPKDKKDFRETVTELAEIIKKHGYIAVGQLAWEANMPPEKIIRTYAPTLDAQFKIHKVTKFDADGYSVGFCSDEEYEEYSKLEGQPQSQPKSDRGKSIRDKLATVLSVLIEMEKETGLVEKGALVSELELKNKMARAEAERIIIQLLNSGTIYEFREGYLKKT